MENSFFSESGKAQGAWRKPYGGDVGSTFVAGQEEQAQQAWRKPYGVDTPAMISPEQIASPLPADNGNAGQIDPLTGQPLPRRSDYISTEFTNPSAQTTQPQTEIQRYRLLVDSALDHHTEGYGGNLVMGGVGGILGARTVPWIMDQVTRGVKIDPTDVPTTLRQRVTQYWQNNHNPKTWNGPDLKLVGQKVVEAADAAGTPGATVAAGGTAATKLKSVLAGYGPSFLKGAGVAGSLMVADHYADQLLFGKNHGNGIGDSINSALVPAALLIGPKTSMWKMGMVGAGALVAGKFIGSTLGEGEHPTYSKVFSQSTGESIVLAAEALLPMKPLATGGLGELMNWKRAAILGGTWLAFRAWNAVDGPQSQAETKDKAWELLDDDAKRRTGGSMNNAIDKFAALGASDESHGIMQWTNVFKEGLGKVKGARGESALQVYRTEWLTKPTNEFDSLLEGMRGAAILCTAFAESRLANGTHVSSEPTTPTYLLEGKNLDLGAKAARDFIIARNNVESAKKQVQDNLGKEIAGKTVEQSEIADLDRVKERIESSEAKIYGKHDLTGAVKDLAIWGKGLNATHILKIADDLKRTIAANRESTDDRYKAKLYRDLATVYLSVAYGKQNGDPHGAAQLLGGDTNSGRMALDMTGQQFGYDGALDCIARAIQLDGNNPDLPELTEIAKQINSKLPANIRKQMESGTYNPLQIRH